MTKIEETVIKIKTMLNFLVTDDGEKGIFLKDVENNINDKADKSDLKTHRRFVIAMFSMLVVLIIYILGR